LSKKAGPPLWSRVLNNPWVVSVVTGLLVLGLGIVLEKGIEMLLAKLWPLLVAMTAAVLVLIAFWAREIAKQVAIHEDSIKAVPGSIQRAVDDLAIRDKQARGTLEGQLNENIRQLSETIIKSITKLEERIGR
jgi:hypothetical protein